MNGRIYEAFPALVFGLAFCACLGCGTKSENGMRAVEESWPVWDVAFSPDGRWLAAGRGYRDSVQFWPEGGDGAINVWNANDWKLQSGFVGPFTFWAGAVAFTPDSKNLIAASDNYVRFKRDPRLGKRDSQGRLIGGAPNPWGGHSVFVWKVPEGTLSQHMKIDRAIDGLTSWLAISPSGEFLTVGCWSRVQVLQIKTGQEIYALEDTVFWVDFSPDGKTLAGASKLPSIGLYNAANGKKLVSFDLKSGELTCLRFSPDGKQIAVGVSDGSVRLLAADLSKQLREIELSADAEEVKALAYAAKADLLAAATTAKVHLFEASSGKQLREWGRDDRRVSAVTLSPDGKLLAISYGGKHIALGEVRGGYVKVWDTATGQLVKQLD